MDSTNENVLLKTFFHFSAGPWLAAVISFITTPITTYFIIPQEFGKASMYSVALSLILQVVLLGTDQSFVRMFYEVKEEERTSLLWNSLLVPVFSCLVCCIVLIFFRSDISNLLFGVPDRLFPIIMLSSTLMISLFERFSTLVLRMKKRGLAFSSLRVVSVVSNTLGIIFYALFFGKSFYAVIFGSFLSNLLVCTVSISLEIKFWKKGLSLSSKKIKEVIFYGLPFVPAFLVSWLFVSMDKLALRSYSTFTEIGLYAAGNKIVAVLLLIQTGFSTFWTPISFERFGQKDSNLFYSRIAQLLAGLMFLLSVVTITFKDFVIMFLAGAYLPAAKIMPFLIFHPLMYTVSEVTVVGINFKKRTYWHILVSILSAGVNFIGNYFLVPIYGAKGAALSTGVAYIVFFYARTIISRKLYPVYYSVGKFTIGTITLFFVAFINTFSGMIILEILSGVIGGIIIVITYSKELNSGVRLIHRLLKKRNRDAS